MISRSADKNVAPVRDKRTKPKWIGSTQHKENLKILNRFILSTNATKLYYSIFCRKWPEITQNVLNNPELPKWPANSPSDLKWFKMISAELE